MSDVRVRLAEISDADTVGRLLRDFNEEFHVAGPTTPEFAGRFKALLGRGDVAVVLADDSGRDAGFALLTLRPTPYYDGALAQLEELYVVPSLRDRGVGTLILRMAIETVRSRGAREMHINVDEIDEDARRFYERHGFSNIEGGKDYRMLSYVQEL
ncbi:GNAT family N-acetyltransferase [Terrabacter sp. BE26]|uniref:GNAT family N-acetyltransferase n=1 Tax=Terrabacter sp. BE26 TaxID=2898152 RepID=UPI0035BE9F05